MDKKMLDNLSALKRAFKYRGLVWAKAQTKDFMRLYRSHNKVTFANIRNISYIDERVYDINYMK